MRVAEPPGVAGVKVARCQALPPWASPSIASTSPQMTFKHLDARSLFFAVASNLVRCVLCVSASHRRHVHHIYWFVAGAYVFGETRSTRSVIFRRKGAAERVFGGNWNHEMRESPRKVFCGLILCDLCVSVGKKQREFALIFADEQWVQCNQIVAFKATKFAYKNGIMSQK